MNEYPDSSDIKERLGTGSINIFGTPFAGKDTQGEILAKFLDAPLIGGGDILRNSVIPGHIQDIMHEGRLIPTEDYLQIVLPYFSQKQFSEKPLVLSSVGRWHGEEFGVIKALKQSSHTLHAVIFLQLDERLVWRRWEESQGHDLRGKRHDDAAEALEVRLEEFSTKTRPVIDFYRDLGLLTEIDANQPVEVVTQTIFSALSKPQ